MKEEVSRVLKFAEDKLKINSRIKNKQEGGKEL
jgi:hypothetical protein